MTTQPAHNRQRGYGGVALAVHPAIKYTLVQKSAEETIQYITIRVAGAYMNTLYISPTTTAEAEKRILNNMAQQSRKRSIIMGDLNARNPAWDSTSNARGTRMKAWMESNGWQINVPPIATCHTMWGSSNPDVCISRGCTLTDVHVPIDDWAQISDHKPICCATMINHDRLSVNGPIPHRHRNNPSCIYKAANLFKIELPNIIENIKKVKQAMIWKRFTKHL